MLLQSKEAITYEIAVLASGMVGNAMATKRGGSCPAYVLRSCSAPISARGSVNASPARSDSAGFAPPFAVVLVDTYTLLRICME